MPKLERFKIPVSVFVILRQDDKILMQLRQGGALAGCWGFVGGHLEGGEQIGTAAVREVKEEVGVTVQPEDLTLKTIFHKQDGGEYLQFYFECCRWSGEIENKEPGKCVRLAWFEWKSLPDNTCPATLQAVAKINNSVSFSEDIF